MKKIKLVKTFGVTCLALTLAVSAPLTTPAAVEADYSIPTGYTVENLVWSDEFNGTTLNTDDWNYEKGNGNNGWGNAESQYYTNSQDNVYIADISSDTTSNSLDGKALAIKAKRDDSINDYNYTSGRITTSTKHTFKYGRVEAKIKMDNGMNRGVWPAFWMLGQPNNWPYCGEIDIMEHANADNFIGGTLHWGDETVSGDQHRYKGGHGVFYGEDMDSWHTYAVEWDDTTMKWYLDDREYYTISLTDTVKSEIVNNEFYIIFNVAIGGYYLGGPNVLPSSTWTDSTMYVDYVRVYQKQEGASSTGTWTKDSIWQNYNTEPTTSNICNVKFMDGETTHLSGTLTKGQFLNNVNISKTGYTFLGWYTADGNKFDFNKQVYADELILYAKWEAATTDSNTQTTVNVKKPSIASIKSKAKRKVNLKFKSKEKVKGFQIKYGTNKKITKKVKTKTTTKKKITIKKLKSKTTYYFKVRAYKTSNGKRVYSKWSSVKKVKVK